MYRSLFRVLACSLIGALLLQTTMYAEEAPSPAPEAAVPAPTPTPEPTQTTAPTPTPTPTPTPEPTQTPAPTPTPPAPVAPAGLDGADLLLSKTEVGVAVTAAAPFAYRIQEVASPPQLIIDFPDAHPVWRQPPARVANGDVLARKLRWNPLPGNGTRLVLDLAYAVPDWQDSGWSQGQDGVYRLTVKAKRQFVQQQEFPVSAGVKFGLQRRGELYGPVMVNMLALWLTEPGVRLGVGLGKDKALGLETVSSMVKRTGALAGINATFFHSNGLPLGLIVDNGLLVSTPVYDRTAFIILDDGSVGLDRADLRARVTLGDGSAHTVFGFNRTRKANEIVVYNQAFGSTTPRSPATHELIVRDGKVIAIGNGGTAITPGVTVVAGDPGGVLKSVQVGAQCLVTWELSLLGNKAVVPGYRIRFAVSGGPRLVSGGKVDVNAAEEQFRPDVAQGRAPRTAVGITAEGVILLVTVNGRQEGVSVGMTLEELAALMVELGAVEAMNFDGGGSTTMVVRNHVVNMPSDGKERAVSSALLVFAASEDAANR